MALERTFGIVKPDAVAKGAIGGVIDMIEKFGLKIIGVRMLRLSGTEAETFYAVHKERPFYRDLVKFMTSGPVVVMAIEGENAIARYREVMGPTDSRKAPEERSVRNTAPTSRRTPCTAATPPTPPRPRSRSSLPALRWPSSR